jgi:hypothetical protein
MPGTVQVHAAAGREAKAALAVMIDDEEDCLIKNAADAIEQDDAVRLLIRDSSSRPHGPANVVARD